MKFLNILDKVKNVAIIAGAVFPGTAPILSAITLLFPEKVKHGVDTVLQRAPADLVEFIDLCVSIEKLVEAAKKRGEVISSTAKAAMLSQAIAETISKAELLANVELVDEALLKKAMDGYAQATVDFLKAVRPKD